MTVNATQDIDGLRQALPALAAEARARAEEFEAARTLAPDFGAKL